MSEPLPFQTERPLSEVCTLGIGGPAQYFTTIHSVEEMKNTLQLCRQHNLKPFILGKGSNTLFDNKGFRGVVIQNKIDHITEPSPGVFIVGAGYSFSRLGALTARHGWSGLEFASGIPGTVGGAIYMNAGANGSETCDSLISILSISKEGQLITTKRDELTFGYRTSPFQDNNAIILEATFALKPSPTARQKQLDIIGYRTDTQPYGELSAGCMFRNPDGTSAGSLIDQCGLKGLTVGGAKISELHANFIINTGTGTSKDILELIKLIKKQVKDKMGIDLESEVRYIPDTTDQL